MWFFLSLHWICVLKFIELRKERTLMDIQLTQVKFISPFPVNISVNIPQNNPSMTIIILGFSKQREKNPSRDVSIEQNNILGNSLPCHVSICQSSTQNAALWEKVALRAATVAQVEGAEKGSAQESFRRCSCCWSKVGPPLCSMVRTHFRIVLRYRNSKNSGIPCQSTDRCKKSHWGNKEDPSRRTLTTGARRKPF